jgi:hypothetical protein
LTRSLYAVALICASFLGSSRPARAADFIMTPFVGSTFAGETTFRTAESLDGTKKWTLGASGAWLTSGVLGVEGEFSLVPRFFPRGGLPTNVTGRNVTTFMGNVIVAAPLSVTRESLRPYVSGGFGLMHAAVNDPTGFYSLDANLAAYSIGGGAIGFFNSRAGVRFDLRHIRSTSSDPDTATGNSEARLGFWRATIGVAIRY